MSTADPNVGPTPTPSYLPGGLPPGYVGDAYPQGMPLPPGVQLQPGMPGPLYLEPPTSVLAICSLVFGIGGFVFLPFLGSIAAVICGHMARNELRRRQGQLRGDGLAMAGLILGYIGIALTILAIVGIIVILFLDTPRSSF